MPFRLVDRRLDDILIIEPMVFPDERGFFMESFRSDSFKEFGIEEIFHQDNHSLSRKGVIRGLHFQWNPPMGKLMRVSNGSAYLVAVDIRPGSPFFGKHFGITASSDNRLQIWAPSGFARGFCVLSEQAEIQYKCTATYHPAGELAIRWNDPDIGIAWPIESPLLSAKDMAAMSLREWIEHPIAHRFAMQTNG